MRKTEAPEDLSIEELRRLLVEKRRSARRERLEHFRRTGRVVTLVSDTEDAALENLRSGSDEEPQEEPVEVPPQPRSKGRRVFDAGLLIIEISAVLVLIFLLVSAAKSLSAWNKETISELAMPTLTPTPLIVEVVLPSGHTPPDSPGGAKPNEAEIPEWLRPQVQSMMSNIPIPTAGPEQTLRIMVPAINVEAPVVIGDGWDQLKKGVGQHISSANPGEKGNVVLTAHNDVFGQIFRELDKLKQGDLVILYTSQRSYTYVVTGTSIVAPTQVDVMSSTQQATVTLISCYPYMKDTQRIIVTALLQTGNR